MRAYVSMEGLWRPRSIRLISVWAEPEAAGRGCEGRRAGTREITVRPGRPDRHSLVGQEGAPALAEWPGMTS